MEYFAAIDVSLELSNVCVVDGTGKIICEKKVASEPEALVAWFNDTGLESVVTGELAGMSRITRPNRVRRNLSSRRARLNWWAWV